MDGTAGLLGGAGARGGDGGVRAQPGVVLVAGAETRLGVIRAELVLRPAGETFRRAPIPGAGVLRPMWDIGNRRDDGTRDLDIARVWVEFAPDLAPGARAPVRLLPLTSARWRHLATGDRITMYETAAAGGTATILEVQLPSA